MKQNNRDCKIVQDLLPNYIENLTDEVTNEYIEEHIATCAECAQMLKDMNGELKLEQINQEHEIKYLDGLRKRVRRTILIVALVIMVIAGCVVGYVYKKSQIQVNNYTFLRISYMKEIEEKEKVREIQGTMVAVFDENDICVSVRVVEDGYTEEEIEAQKNAINTSIEGFSNNLKIINKEIHYNINIWNGNKKEEMKENLMQYYIIKEIEEL